MTNPTETARTERAARGQEASSIYVAAVRADHFARCTRCREVHAAAKAAADENAESMARRDRRQLGLNIGGRRMVAAGAISGRVDVRITEAGVTGVIRKGARR
ncbi:hypothetical protein HEP81_06521 [Streptomyces griseofuscus]|uniref:Uncharacterized protein n=1 Tax=Streptomyces griseofuscus TaxID=146922 RepID=A0A7H1Q8X6_9ACTN|nr:hypothetical protein [Streptomyces griseofuscus]QNT96756.1 hypothetical protein HEP81_06521 [Streptomyces griseofuscus]